MFCLLISEMKILAIRMVNKNKITSVEPKLKITTRKPNVVINQNRKATINEFPKKVVTFFEKPLTASLNP